MTTAQPELIPTKRIQSLDLLRGLIMVLMVLDHTRHFFHAFPYEPEDLSHTSLWLFLTRWITHLCAPGFALFAGMSISMLLRKIKDKNELSMYLFTRGVFLVLLEITVIRFSWHFSVDYSSIGGLVIWALGWCMIIMSVLIRMPLRYLFPLGILIVLGHNLLDFVKPEDGTLVDLLWSFLHVHKSVHLTEHFSVNILYPVLPMLGVVILGFTLGDFYARRDPSNRFKDLLEIGMLLFSLFIVVRGINLYGDPQPWVQYDDPIYTFMSFLNCTKYPFSLSFTLMTCSLLLVMLAGAEMLNAKKFKMLTVFGKEPLFFYVVHLFILHTLALLFAIVKFHEHFREVLSGRWDRLAEDYGYDLWVVYVVWIGVVIVLYPITLKWVSWKKDKPGFFWKLF